RFIDQVGKISAGKAWRPARKHTQVNFIVEGNFSDMHLEYLLTATDIRQPDKYLPVEPAGAQQRIVQYIGTVGGRDNNNALVAFKSIHLHQQLVQGLLP